MNIFIKGDVMSTNKSLKKDKESLKILCDFCYNNDEFSLCADCFNKFNSKILRYKGNIRKENYELNNSIKEYIDKRKNEIEKFNKIYSRKSNIENLKKIIKISKLRVNKNKENIQNLKNRKICIENKIINLEENVLDLNNSIISFRKNNHHVSETIQKKILEKNIQIKNFFKKLIKLLFCGNNIYFFSEIFEKDEYILPTLDKGHSNKKKYFDDFSNILSTEVKSNENYGLDDNKKFYQFEKYLKIKESIINYNMNPYPYSNQKNLKPENIEFFNKIYVGEINNYVHKIILFVKIASKFLNIKLPCTIESENRMEISDNSDFNEEKRILFIADEFNNFNESNTFSALLALDKNLNFVKDFIGIKIKKPNLFPNYFNSNNYNIKNNFEFLNFDYNHQNNVIHRNFRNNHENKRKHNCISANSARNNTENLPNMNNTIKINIATCNNVEFNSEFLNMIPFFIYSGENYELKKFSINCEILKNQIISIENEKDLFGSKSKNKKDRFHLKDDNRFEILFHNKKENKYNNCTEFVYEDFEYSQNDNNDINKKPNSKNNVDEDNGGFVIIDNYFSNENN